MKLTIEQVLKQGVAAHKEGKLQDAERLYRAILESQPLHPDANHNLGVLAVSVNKVDAALPLFKTALETNPKIEQFWLSYIDALIRAEKIDAAIRVLADAPQAGVTAAKLLVFEKQIQFELSPSSHMSQQELDNPQHSNQGELSTAIELREVGKYKEAQEWLYKFVPHSSDNPETLSLLSQVLLLDKKEVEAERVLKAAASINSELPSIYRNQARLLLKKSKNAEALEKAQLGCKQSPEDLESLLVLAACLGANKRDSEALPIIEKILKAKSNHAEAYANRALIKLRTGDSIGAIKDAKMTVSLKPHLTQMWQLLGFLYHQNSNLIKAIEALKNAHKTEPYNPAFMIQLGDFLVQGNKVTEAISILEKATELAPKDTDAWTNLGIAFQQQKRIADAKTAYEKALTLNPKSAVIASNLGTMAKEAGEWASALGYFEKTLEIEPGLADAHNNLGVTLQELGKLDEAAASYTKAITLKPDLAEAHNNMAITLKELGRLDDAEASYNQAVALKPDLAGLHYNLGVTLQELGKLDEALASYNQAIELKPDLAEAHSNLGNTLKELGRLDDAEASYNQAVALKPDLAEAHSNLGNTLKELGRLDDAEASYYQAIVLKPDYAEAHSNLGVTLQELGRLHEAETSYNQAIALNSHNPEVWDNIFFTLRTIKNWRSYGDGFAPFLQNLTDTEYAKIAKSLLHYKLNLGRANCEIALGEALSVLSKADNMVVKNSLSDAALTGVEIKSPDKIIALVHFGRSGTGVIHSLIDNHPDVSTLPSIYLSEYFDRSTWEKIISSGWDQMIDRFMNTYDVLFDATSAVPIDSKAKKRLYHIGEKEGMINLGEKRNETLITDKVVFRAELRRLMDNFSELTAFSFFKLVHAAYDKAIGDAHEKKCIFYHIHNPDTYAQLNFVQFAPDAQWMMMVREPLQSCESWIRSSFRNKKYPEMVNKILGSLFEVDNIVYHKKNALGVRLEDLKEFPNKTIPALCDWMGIEETPSLYEMTAQGKKWWGDPVSPDYLIDGMEPFGKTSVNRKVGSIFSVKDQFILRTLFYPFSVRFGYAEADPAQFAADLEIVRPLLDQLFDFEKALIDRTKTELNQFLASGSYLYFRSGLIERWEILNEFGTYPNMIKPLRVH